MIRVGKRKSVAKARTRSVPAEYRLIEVGIDKQYTTIEAAVAALNTLAPDDNDPVLIYLDSGTWNLTDASLEFPDNSGILARDTSPANTTIKGVASGVHSTKIITTGSGQLFEGFTYNAGTSSAAANFKSVREATVETVLRRLIIEDSGNDVLFITHGGDYLVDRSDITVHWDGVYPATLGSATSMRVRVNNSYIHHGADVAAWHNCIRCDVDSDACVVEVNNSKIVSQSRNVSNIYGAAIASGGLTVADKAYTLIMRGSIFETDVQAGYTGSACYAIRKHTGKMEAINCAFNLTDTPRNGTDYCIDTDNCTDYENGFINCTVSGAGMTTAQCQNIGGSNAVTGLPIS